MKIGERIRQLREAAHVSRGELSMHTGLRENHIQKIENGWTGNPGYMTVGIILEVLGADPSEFWKSVADSVPDLAALGEGTMVSRLRRPNGSSASHPMIADRRGRQSDPRPRRPLFVNRRSGVRVPASAP